MKNASHPSRIRRSRPRTSASRWLAMGLVAAAFHLGPVALVIGATGRWDGWVLPEANPASAVIEPTTRDLEQTDLVRANHRPSLG